VSYKFRKDDDTVIEVDWTTMMNARDGILKLDDGSVARRVHEGGSFRKSTPVLPVNPKTVSSALGCIDDAVDGWREHARLHGHSVEFVQDPLEPRFYNAHFDSEKERIRYVESRQFFDKNPHSGSALSPGMLEDAQRRVIEEYK
tara:strand:+ start:334 stop:765 length:432 start_codon:yes stop_codon:yes gene_type:complete